MSVLSFFKYVFNLNFTSSAILFCVNKIKIGIAKKRKEVGSKVVILALVYDANQFELAY